MNTKAASKPKAISTAVASLLPNAKTSPVRSMLDFALEEVVLPMDGGPREGEQFTADAQPFAALLLDVLSGDEFSEYYITGPSQSGKSLIAFIVPIAYHSVELGKNMVIAVPDMNMADNKWRIDIEPVFANSPSLRKQLPTSGQGSKGGKVKDSITLQNGAVLKFMSPFGDDANRAGFTASTVCVTEAARFSSSSATSVEADPLRQLKARQRSRSRFNEDGELNTERVMIVEGTVTLPHELPSSARANSSNSRIVCQCPHCKEWVTPEREDLKGWQDAKTEIEASQKAYFACRECGKKWTDKQRIAMNRNCRLIHEGQTVSRAGKVCGSTPQTAKFWFRWNAFNNLFTNARDLGYEEWMARQIEEGSEQQLDAEKDLCQSIWCIPFEPPTFDDLTPLDRKEVAKRLSPEQYPAGVLPADTIKLTVGIDIGRKQCWYFVLAWRANHTIHCPMYGMQSTSLDQTDAKNVAKEVELAAIYNAIKDIRDKVDVGLPVYGSSNLRRIDQAFIDSRYCGRAVDEFCKNIAGRKVVSLNADWAPIMGVGESVNGSTKYRKPKQTDRKTTRKIGTGFHIDYESSRRAFVVYVDADFAKLAIQDALRVSVGKPGSLTFYNGESREHERVARHLASEVRETFMDARKGLVTRWKGSGQNHLLDSAGYAFVAGLRAGVEYTPAVLTSEPVEEGETIATPVAAVDVPPKTGWLSRVV